MENYCLFGIQKWSSICMPRAEWSGWVQAVGSIAAIVVGAAAVWWQVHKQRRHSLEEDVRRLRIISATSYSGRAVINISDGTLNAERAQLHLRELRRLLDSLAAIPLLDIPDWRTSLDLMAIAAHRDRMTDLMKEHPSTVDVTAPRFLLDIYRMLGAINSSADAAIKRRGFLVDRRASLPDEPTGWRVS
jgi:hypothetical protein